MSANEQIVKVPDVGEGIAEVELVAWHVAVGDTVAEDQALADVMTDKASVEIPSPAAGTVLALGGAVGQMMAVGAELIRIGKAGGSELAAAPMPQAPRVAAPVSAPMAASMPAAQAVAPSTSAAAPHVAAPAPAPSPALSIAPAEGPAARPLASPSVRRRAWELGVDLSQVSASGSGGRIVHADLDAHVAQRDAAAAQPTPTSPVAPAASAASASKAGAYRPAADFPPLGTPRTDETAVPVIGLRRRIAQQMQESKRHIPHFSYVEEVDVTELDALRNALNTRHAETRGRLTLLPLLMRAVVLALRDFPQMNARFDDEAGIVTRHGAAHLGIATQTAQGLMVPVVRHAEALSVWAMAAEMARLAEAARSGRATRAELSGSTLTISSLGALGGIVSTPVINRPEVAIIAVNRMVERPMLRGGAVVARQMMNLSSSFDHRVIDGMDAARFVQALRALLEAPGLLFAE